MKILILEIQEGCLSDIVQLIDNLPLPSLLILLLILRLYSDFAPYSWFCSFSFFWLCFFLLILLLLFLLILLLYPDFAPSLSPDYAPFSWFCSLLLILLLLLFLHGDIQKEKTAAQKVALKGTWMHWNGKRISRKTYISSPSCSIVDSGVRVPERRSIA